MKYIILVTVLFCILMCACYAPLKKYLVLPEKADAGRDATQGKMFFWCILGITGLVRIIVAGSYRGYDVDMNCFMGWSNMVYENGFHKFYYLENAFTDYPPGYMYVLYIIGWLRSVLNLGEGTAAIILTKLPAMAADMASACLLYKIAGQHISKKGAAFLAGIFLITPSIFLDSTVWGQVDSVFTIFVLLMCYLVTEKKLIPSYFAFAIGILIKPQTLIFTPVLIFGIIDQVIIERYGKEPKEVFWKNFLKHLGFGLLAILMMFLLIIPFGFHGDFADNPIIKQYVDTISSYPYASVNAYNFWGLLGKIWTSQTEGFLHFSYKIWGAFFILQILVLAAFVNFRSRIRETKYYFSGALIVTGMFTLSVRMHERYVYPAVVLLIICFVIRPKVENFILYVSLSAVSFLNMAEIMFFYDPNNYDRQALFPRVVSLFMLLVFDLMLYVTITQYLRGEKQSGKEENISKSYRRKLLKDPNRLEKIREAEEREKARAVVKPVIRRSEKLPKLAKMDFILMAVITFCYAFIAFINLGNRTAPETSMSFVETSKEKEVIFDFGENVQISKIWDYLGSYNNPKYRIDYAAEGDEQWSVYYDDSNPWDAGGVFCWNSQDLSVTARLVKITPAQNTYQDSILELAFTDENKKKLVPVNQEEYKNLFDEPDTLTKREQYDGHGTHQTGTYFDEIYHARTAYEMIHDLYCYENTHPPLGKIFISLGIRMFGMNPFGWRFMGTLFGVLMLPVFYLFGKKMFGKTWLTACVTTLFAFDFMHFAQTRIATIDVFVTFFIILMYFFMYWYTKQSFFDSVLKETLVPLGLCGITMGFAWACKWTGIYASAGLCILFFATMGQRFREYLYAKKSPNASTDGIAHSEILRDFWKKTGLTLAFCVIFFILIPAVIYTLSYLGFDDKSGHGLIRQMLDNQKTMFNYHSNLEATHPYSSLWYEWPVMKRPIWFFSGQVSDTLYEGISSFGNPLVWWAGIPAFLYLLYQWTVKKDRLSGFLVIGYLSQYLPWVFIGRVVFIYHYFPSVPFVVLMLGCCFMKIVKKKPSWQWGIYVYTGLAVCLFLLFYPVLAGEAVSPEYVDRYLRWFDDWQLLGGVGEVNSIFTKVLGVMDQIARVFIH